MRCHTRGIVAWQCELRWTPFTPCLTEWPKRLEFLIRIIPSRIVGGVVMKTVYRFLALVFSCAFIPPVLVEAQQTEARTALVIGNGAYPNNPLKNPTNDAEDIAQTLVALGFNVTKLIDANYAAMGRAIDAFGRQLEKDRGIGLFYYAGHGVQYQGANYLIPADSDIQNPQDLPYDAIDVGKVLAKMEAAGNHANIVILDACRNNPFPGSERSAERGLAIVARQPPESMVIYATQPGATARDGEGRNGVFTASFLHALSSNSSASLDTLMMQVTADVKGDRKSVV
jgi:uncharacterized caspase-like protein